MSAVAVAVVSKSGDKFAPKDPAGSEFFYWDFTNSLRPGEIVVSAVVTAHSVFLGADNSAAMVTGSALVMNGTVVRQQISAGDYGISYYLKCAATTSIAGGIGQVIPLTGILPIGGEFGVVS
jgi:hypothetical protein